MDPGWFTGVDRLEVTSLWTDVHRTGVAGLKKPKSTYLKAFRDGSLKSWSGQDRPRNIQFQLTHPNDNCLNPQLSSPQPKKQYTWKVYLNPREHED